MFAVATKILALFVNLRTHNIRRVSPNFKRGMAYHRLIVAFVAFFKLVQ